LFVGIFALRFTSLKGLPCVSGYRHIEREDRQSNQVRKLTRGAATVVAKDFALQENMDHSDYSI